MDVVLLHNPKAGDGDAGRQEITRALERQGCAVTYQSVKEEHFHRVLDEPADLVAVAGGDGTLRKVFPRLAGRPRRPVLVLPAGTANNLARNFGLGDDWQAVVRRLPELRPQPFHFGRVLGKVEGLFFEGVGIGIFTALLDVVKNQGERIEELGGGREGFARDHAALASLTRQAPAIPLQVVADSAELETEALWMEVMNIRSIGPHVDFGGAPEMPAETLRMVVVPPARREALAAYFQARAEGREAEFPPVDWYALGGHARIAWDGGLYHLDDELRKSPAPTGEAALRLERLPDPLPVLR